MEMIIFPALSLNFRPQILFANFWFSNLGPVFSCSKFPRELSWFPQISCPKTKNPLGWRVGRIFFPLNSLTETPPATRMDAK